MDTQTQELTIIDRSIDTFKDAGEVLRNNQSRASKAIAVGKKILADLAANGGVMTPELDTRMQNYLANCNTAKTDMNEGRKIFTQTMTIIAKAFTSEENKLDATTAGTEAFEIQQIRNAYAKQLHEAEQERLRLVKLQQEKDTATINIKAECKQRLLTYTSQYTSSEKMRINTAFNAITLENFEARSSALKNMLPAYPYAQFSQFVHGITSKYFTPSEVDTMLKLLIEGEFLTIADDYRNQVAELRDFLVDRLPAKKQELEAIWQQEQEIEAERLEQERLRKERETANAEDRKKLDQQKKESQERQRIADNESKRIADEKKKREDEERARIADEERKRQEQQQQAIADDKEVETMTTLFGAEVENSAASSPKPETRQGYEIEVTGAPGWMQIFQTWFNETGKTLDNDKIAGTKMEAMKTYCEKIAHKDAAKKITSNFLIYTPSFKAVNRKVK